MTSNEAAERLRFYLTDDPDAIRHLDEALAAERRATVERLQSNVRLVLLRHHVSDEDIATCDVCSALRRAILDEEAAR
jgi:ABC-type multidrug transport system ATPase subunit